MIDQWKLLKDFKAGDVVSNEDGDVIVEIISQNRNRKQWPTGAIDNSTTYKFIRCPSKFLIGKENEVYDRFQQIKFRETGIDATWKPLWEFKPGDTIVSRDGRVRIQIYPNNNQTIINCQDEFMRIYNLQYELFRLQ